MGKTVTTQQMIDRFRHARRACVPIIAINTPDPASTIRMVVANTEDPKEGGVAVKIAWDIVGGLLALTEDSKAFVAQEAETVDPTQNDPVALCEVVRRLPRKSVVCMHLGHRWLGDPAVVQAIWNLRDLFKRDGRTLVLLCRSVQIPPELGDDVIVLEEPLPDATELAGIVRRLHEGVQLPLREEHLGDAVDALRGVSAFAAEQITAMSLRKSGLDLGELWDRKKQQIEQCPALRVLDDPDESFASIGGCESIKSYLSRVLEGQGRPRAIVFLDEIEKMIAGTGDTSGVSQDQLGVLLSYMQDQKCSGMIFIGPPGAAKSAVAKAAGNSAGIPTIQLDLGAARGSLVGESEQRIRDALKVVTAVSAGSSLWIATCNSFGQLPPELRRRFTLGTFFFDLPTAEERRKIWEIYCRRYFDDAPVIRYMDQPQDEGWTGAEIRQCCDIAWRLECGLVEAADYIVPVSRSAADSLRKLREQANGRFLSASHRGVYRLDASHEQPVLDRPVTIE